MSVRVQRDRLGQAVDEDVVDARVGVEGVARLGEVHLRREEQQRPRHRETFGAGTEHQRRREVAAGRRAGDDDLLRGPDREQRAVHGHAVVERRGIRVVRRHAVVDRPRVEPGTHCCAGGHQPARFATTGDERTTVDVVEHRRVGARVGARRSDHEHVDAVDVDLLDRGIKVQALESQRDERVHHRDALLPGRGVVERRERLWFRQPARHHRAPGRDRSLGLWAHRDGSPDGAGQFERRVLGRVRHAPTLRRVTTPGRRRGDCSAAERALGGLGEDAGHLVGRQASSV